MIEAVKDGKQAMKPIYVEYPEKDTLLIMIRRKGKLRCVFSPDGGTHLIAFHEFVLDLPKKVKIGLTAANISAKPLSVTFENFAVITDTKTLELAGRGWLSQKPDVIGVRLARSCPDATTGEFGGGSERAWRPRRGPCAIGRAAGIHSHRDRMPARRERRGHAGESGRHHDFVDPEPNPRGRIGLHLDGSRRRDVDGTLQVDARRRRSSISPRRAAASRRPWRRPRPTFRGGACRT